MCRLLFDYELREKYIYEFKNLATTWFVPLVITLTLSPFAQKGNQSRHEHRYHPEEVGLPVFTCCICLITCRNFPELEQHLRTYQQKFTNHIIS